MSHMKQNQIELKLYSHTDIDIKHFDMYLQNQILVQTIFSNKL